jgi:hypothetical protein
VGGRESGYGVWMTGDRQIIFSGEWVEGKMQGNGTYYFPNGDIYIGQSPRLTLALPDTLTPRGVERGVSPWQGAVHSQGRHQLLRRLERQSAAWTGQSLPSCPPPPLPPSLPP